MSWPASAASGANRGSALEEWAAELGRLLPGRLLVGEPMSAHTTLRVGGKADLFLLPADLEELKSAVRWCGERGLPVKVLGNGSNLLVSDRGVRGAVIKLTPRFSEVEFNSEGVVAGAGVKLARLLARAAEAGWSGLESLVGVPGTLGGALATNAGTDIGSIGDLLLEAEVMDERGEITLRRAEDFGYRYRYSSLLGSRLMVLSARLRLERAPVGEIAAKMERLRVKRASRQPLRSRSAGSVFKNPAGIAAGKVLDRAGAKGRRVGGAEVSRKHANFILNRGKAKAAEVRELMEQLRALARRVYDLELEPEVELLGEW
jgi:UDP-N-acetylmuramate dehydrogenase